MGASSSKRQMAASTRARWSIDPRENFNAIISAEIPSADAIGFKLDVCYRVVQDTVSYAVKDFKH